MENFSTTATLNRSGKYYQHFGIRKELVSLYGDNAEDIVEVELKISTDQSVPEGTTEGADYWGWYDKDKGFGQMIYAQYFLLNMCFPYGIKASEERGQGKAYRLEIVNVK